MKSGEVKKRRHRLIPLRNPRRCGRFPGCNKTDDKRLVNNLKKEPCLPLFPSQGPVAKLGLDLGKLNLTVRKLKVCSLLTGACFSKRMIQITGSK